MAGLLCFLYLVVLQISNLVIHGGNHQHCWLPIHRRLQALIEYFRTLKKTLGLRGYRLKVTRFKGSVTASSVTYSFGFLCFFICYLSSSIHGCIYFMRTVW
ncbi:hypothetical protein BT93_H1787 [Corymbia citriodora subsp. variegata]|nr:hypothetical protein BT93_H1787 [Corymbia citriodora subsp. variegata]